MSRIARNVSNLMRISLNNRLIQTTGKSLPQIRSISSVVTNGSIGRRHHTIDNKEVTVVSKRFAANSPKVAEELTQFLKSEIELEMKSQKKSLPSIPDWNIKNDGSNVVFTKTFGSEEITVRTNVNHSVDTKDFNEEENEEIAAEMVCRPDFAVEIKKGNTILGINCAFIEPEEMDEEQAANPDMKASDKQSLEDEFQINEISVFEGEFKENTYAVSGEVMDGSMYDLLMDLMDERGIDQSFVRNLIEYTTVYEHKEYVGLLEKLKVFFSQN